MEPSETLEMVRLVRAVGDLPNIIYVLCYDRKVLLSNLRYSLKLKDAARYLEKIVQVTVHLPKPESLTLRHWFCEEAIALAGLDANSEADVMLSKTFAPLSIGKVERVSGLLETS